ncbi:BspA family leucine-rich repeat surface protein [Euzebyella marina]|uniref:BspA family leucine-rich repeat surface protein n=1 Tax=Euzebyella marina TaxID=1761453 RepID=A0A3G2LAY5_9FLAO|nr:BspA family leucine-rich repeat surface protein [Euzebyella marina]AYN69363.1 BspA family leucine-rich repeat surface protein [Euzebyella marina]
MIKNIFNLVLGLSFFALSAQSEFISTWKTDNTGISEDNQITIPTYPWETYDYTVDWGDGTFDTGITGDIVHTYVSPGIYTVSISGMFPGIYFNDTTFNEVKGDEDKIINIAQWGNNVWKSMDSAFAGCQNLTVEAQDIPDLSQVTSLRRMFFWAGTWQLHIPKIEEWDISHITNLSGMFDKTSFTQDISGWNVANVRDMSYLFFSSPFNQDISGWDVGNVTNMEGLFGSSSFRQDVTGWDVSSVTNMAFMFNSTFFDQDISGWDVSNVTSMRHMLSQCSFNQDVGDWNVSQVGDLSNIFDDNDLSTENYDKILTGWSQLPSLRSGVSLGAKDVYYCSADDARALLIATYGWSINDQGQNCEPDRPFITTWKTDNPGFSRYDQITIPTNPRKVYNYNVDWGDGTSDSGITEDITHTYNEPGIYQVSISGRFPSIYFNSGKESHQYPSKEADADKIISVDQWGTNRWISMSFAFAGCSNLDVKATDIPDLSKDVFLSAMFLDCPSLIGNESMAQWDLSKTSFTASDMFKGASQFNQPIDQWDVSKLRYLDGMFEDASAFDQNLEGWNIGKVENMDRMFDNSGLSIRNYDKILNAWSNLPAILSSVKLGAISTFYCNSEMARQYLIDNFNWIISDAGGSNLCNEDNDADGVLDDLDRCLNTPEQEVVNEFGCHSLSNENFKIQILGETCPGANNAQLVINAIETNEYTAFINGAEHRFDQDLTIENLVPGSYDFCIKVPPLRFEQCYVVELPEALTISGKSHSTDGKYSLKIDSGTAPYSVLVNGQITLQTNSTDILLDVSQGDVVEVTTDKDCEGVYSEEIGIETPIHTYPNPTPGYFEIRVPMQKGEVKVEIASMESKLIRTEMYLVEGNVIKVDISNLPQGMYFVKVALKKPVVLKIVKQ